MEPSEDRTSRFGERTVAAIALAIAILAVAVGPPGTGREIKVTPRSSPPTLPRPSSGQWPEVAEMLAALVRGETFGPGVGWFHSGQSRHGWEWLAARFDADHDGRITPEELT